MYAFIHSETFIRRTLIVLFLNGLPILKSYYII